MAVEQINSSISNSAKNQTTTLDISSKMTEEHHNEVVTANLDSERAAKVGFVSLGCLS